MALKPWDASVAGRKRAISTIIIVSSKVAAGG
jgi:hypothetical protein